MAQQEVQVLRSLDHPGIVRYHEHFVHGETLCVVMAYCEGGAAPPLGPSSRPLTSCCSASIHTSIHTATHTTIHIATHPSAHNLQATSPT